MTRLVAEIDGMHCTGCENRVTDRLSKIEGVRSVEADHETGDAVVTFVAGREDTDAVRDAVETLGFDIVDVRRG